MASDFHTHDQSPALRALISCKKTIPGKFTSFEFHPWLLPEKFDTRIIPEIMTLSGFAAIGEIGIDKMRGPDIAIQLQYLEKMLELAADLHKPAVIHCVKAFDELFAILKRFPVKIMFHGFRSSPQMLDELWKRNITVSFHPQMVNNEIIMKKLPAACGSFGFESDDNKENDVKKLLEIAEKTSGVKNLEAVTDQNFSDFLGI